MSGIENTFPWSMERMTMYKLMSSSLCVLQWDISSHNRPFYRFTSELFVSVIRELSANSVNLNQPLAYSRAVEWFLNRLQFVIIVVASSVIYSS